VFSRRSSHRRRSELWADDADGKNVTQLTSSPGYDGGAFFSPDCREDRVAVVAAARRELAKYK